MIQKEIKAGKIETMLSLFGNYDENVNLIQREFSVVILGRGENITVSGEEKNVFEASEAINSLITLIEKGETLNETTIRYVFSLVREGRQYEHITPVPDFFELAAGDVGYKSHAEVPRGRERRGVL